MPRATVRDPGGAVLSDLPAPGRWDFGGFAYGLEPLVLPQAGRPHLESASDARPPLEKYAQTCRRFGGALGHAGLAGEVEPCEAADELSWFRWITGHQVCFVLWRLIAELLEDVGAGRCKAEEIAGPVSTYVDGYAAMLLYTGSCSRSVYAGVIRPSMRLQHRAFSGGWAPDYWPIREVIRGRESSVVWRGDSGELREAVDRLQGVHDGVAAKLVADGRSLLRQTTVRGPSHAVAGMIFDAYFMTIRGAVSRQDVLAQLLRRLVAVAQDLTVNGLDDAVEWPAEHWTPALRAFHAGLADVVAEVARMACRVGFRSVPETVHAALRTAVSDVGP